MLAAVAKTRWLCCGELHGMVTKTHNSIFVKSQLQHVLYIHRSGVICWVHTALTLPRLEVQFPPGLHALKTYTNLALARSVLPKRAAALRMNADVLSMYLGYSCFLEPSGGLFARRLCNLAKFCSQEKQRKLESATLVQPIPYGSAITDLQLHPGFCLISGSAWPCIWLVIAPTALGCHSSWEEP